MLHFSAWNKCGYGHTGFADSHITCEPGPKLPWWFSGNEYKPWEFLLEHCAPEAHHQIGMVERRNALLRTILEKLVDQFTATTIDELLYAFGSCLPRHQHGHPHPRQGQLIKLVFWSTTTDYQIATSMIQWCFVVLITGGRNWIQVNSAAYKAEFCEMRGIEDLARVGLQPTSSTSSTSKDPCNQGSRLAAWTTLRLLALDSEGCKETWKLEDGDGFLSWDPSHVGKQAWVRTGGSTTLVTAEQLRGAFGFEDWTPAPEDIRALKDAAHRFDALLDDRGAPPEEQPLDDEDIQAMEELNPETFGIDTKHDGSRWHLQNFDHQPNLQLHHFNLLFVPERPPSLPPMQSQHTQVQQHQTINNYIESPTNITTTNQVVQQQYHRFGTPPRQN